MKRALITGAVSAACLLGMALGVRWGINSAWEREMRERGLWRP